jgi:hypothetical protein
MHARHAERVGAHCYVCYWLEHIAGKEYLPLCSRSSYMFFRKRTNPLQTLAFTRCFAGRVESLADDVRKTSSIIDLHQLPYSFVLFQRQTRAIQWASGLIA